MKFNLPSGLNISNSFIGVPILLLAVLAMVILPLPPWLLDMLFTFNIVLAILVMLVAVSAQRPLEFSVFPTVLLIATLMRLTLNVASTRVVLLEGHNGGDAAGKVIQAFGEVVIGGDYVVGMVVFLILMIINFVVITKGGERISEVSARFTLDSLPGKQMAIDADLNAGALSQDQAKARRAEVAREADFYGSMDGASKFVRGDAIAGILILFINIIGGVAIGVFQHDMAAGDAFRTFSLLTIGDGLVAQIPSLLLATAAAIIVTRVSDAQQMPDQINNQLLANPAVLGTAAGVMAIIALVPGMPALAFGTFAFVLGFAAWQQYRFTPATPLEKVEEKVEQVRSETQAPSWEGLPYTDVFEVGLGYRLVHLVDRSKGAELLNRLTGIRRTLSEQAGFLLPEVRVRDNLTLPPTGYQVLFMGIPVAEGELQPEQLLAIRSGEVYGEIDGILTKDPAYGMDAVWIDQDNKARALNLAYSVVDNATIIATHVSKLMREKLSDLIQHDDITAMTDRLSAQAPRLAESLNAALTPIQQLKIYRLLLREQVSLKDIRTIATTLLESVDNTKDPILLAADVRCALKETILHQVAGQRTKLEVATLAPELEQTLMSAMNQAQQGGNVPLDSFAIEPQLLAQLQSKMPSLLSLMQQQGHPPILLVAPQLRPILARYARAFAKGLNVLSYNEMPEDRELSVGANLG
ncbi:flagellar biosynthesis protein FlhA [Ferrimonas marina]|uniref:Flagellar biosynthesis protein FlhA n=1 Tax=Ferrimonas marina TaxID=299255 RepID=A0A1M5R2L0_9GAMM|nr:flagellar biosynthesis protein FlhA [Ferrimonas marina]SHH20260.1 flagellar biosynthesis protein FlhA [Ferrimonas marina]